MPTWDKTQQFLDDYAKLGEDEKAAFLDALQRPDGFVVGARNQRQFHPHLRVKPMREFHGVWEMTWEKADGRATFEYGPEKTPGDPHIVWRRIGGHDIFGNA